MPTRSKTTPVTSKRTSVKTQRTVPAADIHVTTATQPVEAWTDPDFYYQLKNGGQYGWNDQTTNFTDPAKECFFLRYYGVTVGSAELVQDGDTAKTHITVFASPLEGQPTPETANWSETQQKVVDAIQDLRLTFK